MSQIQINLPGERTAFSPGETITGSVSWQTEQAPRRAELNLLWSTRGKGNEDIEVVTSMPFENPQALESRPFTIVLPDAPYSFSGKLISLSWFLELILEPGNDSIRTVITLAPGAREVTLSRE